MLWNHVSSTGRPTPRQVRLPSLIDDDDTDGLQLRVPFVIESVKLHALLRLGVWRKIPRVGHYDASLGRVVRNEDLLAPATLSHKDHMMVVISSPWQNERDRVINPSGELTFVCAYDVLRVVERVAWSSVGHNYHDGETFRREADGTYLWRGLSEVKDETDVWALKL